MGSALAGGRSPALGVRALAPWVSLVICDKCQHADEFSAAMVCCIVWAPELADPYPLIPAEHYTCCLHCDAVFSLVEKSVEAHPRTRGKLWTNALVVFSDRRGIHVVARRGNQKMAQA